MPAYNGIVYWTFGQPGIEGIKQTNVATNTTTLLHNVQPFLGAGEDIDSLVFDNTQQNIFYTVFGASGGSGRIRKYNIATMADTLVATGFGNQCVDLCMDPGGTSLLFSERQSHLVRRIRISDGTVLNTSPNLSALFDGGNFSPNGIAYDGSGNLFVTADTLIVKLDPTSLAVLGTLDLSAMTGTLDGMCYDSFSGHLWATDGTNNGLWEINPATLTLVASYGLGGPGDGLNADGTGNIVIAAGSAQNPSGEIKNYLIGTGFSALATANHIDDLVLPSGAPPPLMGSCPTATTGTFGTPYTGTVTVSGGSSPYTFGYSGLPPGLSGNTSTGVISGNPSAVGTFNYTITITDTTPTTITLHCTLTIVAASVDCTITLEAARPAIYFWEPSYLERPEDTVQRATDWENDGYEGAKFLQGFILEADTVGANKTVKIQGDQADLQTFTVNHNGQLAKPYTFTTPQVSTLMRLIQTDSNPWRFFGIRYVWEPMPELAQVWTTQATTHDQKGFHFLKDGYIAHISTADITLTIAVDGVTFTYTVPNSGGNWVKTYIMFGLDPSVGRMLKGKYFQYSLSSSIGFRLFKKDCEVRVHPWEGAGGIMAVPGYQIKNPFGDTSRESGARI